MKLKKEIPLHLEGIDGELIVVHSPFGTKLLCNGKEIKKKGFWVMKYPVPTIEGGTDILSLRGTLDFSLLATYQGKEIRLEEKLSKAEMIIGCLPLLLIFSGGAIGGFLGALGVMANYGYMRTEKRRLYQILVSIGMGALCWVTCILIGTLFFTATGKI